MLGQSLLLIEEIVLLLLKPVVDVLSQLSFGRRVNEKSEHNTLEIIKVFIIISLKRGQLLVKGVQTKDSYLFGVKKEQVEVYSQTSELNTILLNTCASKRKYDKKR